MSDAAQDTLWNLNGHVATFERDFLKIADELKRADRETARAMMQAVFRTVARIAEAAEAIKAACPACRGPGARQELTSVNQFSGVWRLPQQCDVCRELTDFIAAVGKAAKSGTQSGG